MSYDIDTPESPDEGYNLTAFIHWDDNNNANNTRPTQEEYNTLFKQAIYPKGYYIRYNYSEDANVWNALLDEDNYGGTQFNMPEIAGYTKTVRKEGSDYHPFYGNQIYYTYTG